MGWNIVILADKNIDNKDVDAVVRSLPDKFKGMGVIDKSWGWSVIVNVYKPNKNKVVLSGSDATDNIAMDFCFEFRKRLSDLGYCTTYNNESTYKLDSVTILTDNKPDNIFLKPTLNFRIVKTSKGDQEKLQQAWEDIYTTEIVWIDIDKIVDDTAFI